MTNETTYREKGRSLFLAAMLVLSVVAASAAFAGGAAADASFNSDNYDEGPTFTDGTANDVWIGQEVTFDVGNDDTNGLEVYQGLNPDISEDSPVTTLRVNDGEATLDTSDLEADEPYTIDDGSANTWDEASFWALEEEVSAEFNDSTVSEDGNVNLDFESERDTQWVNITSSDLDAEELSDLFDHNGNDEMFYEGGEDDLHDDSDVLTVADLTEDYGALDANFSNIDVNEGDEIDFEFSNTDSQASDNASIEISDQNDEREIIDIDSPEEGEIGNITIDVGNTDEAAVSLGDHNENHVVNMTLSDFDTDNDEIVLEHNTYTAGGFDDVEGDESDAMAAGWTAHNATITEFTEVTELDAADPLPAATWDLEVGADTNDAGTNDADFIDDSNDRGLFQIQERSAPADAVLQTAPYSDGVSDIDSYEDATVTETGTIAVDEGGDGDSLFVSVDDFGANGSIEAFEDPANAEDFGQELFEQGNITLNISEQQSSAVGGSDYWNSSEVANTENNLPIEGYTFNTDDYDGELIFEINYQNADGLDVTGESYDVTFDISDDSPLADEDYSDEQEITFEEPSISLDETEEMPANSESNVTGTTNVAPGTEIQATADSPSEEGAFVKTDDPEVNADGTFEASFDLGGESVGSLFDVTVEEPLAGEEDDLEDVELVESTDDNESDEEGLGVDVSADDITVGDTAEFDVTVDNYEDESTTANLTLEVGDEQVMESVDIDADGSAEFTMSVEDLPAGDHDFTVTAEDGEFEASDDGTLTVNEEGSGGDEGDDTGSEDDTSEDDGDTGSEDGDDGDDGSSSVPGFGVAVALVALLSAAMLALRKQD